MALVAADGQFPWIRSAIKGSALLPFLIAVDPSDCETSSTLSAKLAIDGSDR
jgi:hypothetical protein